MCLLKLDVLAMKKSVLALVLLGAPLLVHGQSGVVLYGLLDAGIQHQRVKIDDFGKATRTGMSQGVRAGNRWGLRGSEDLGDGLKAIFTLENGFNLDDGSASDARRTAFNRQAFVGLSSETLGTLTLGRQYNSGFTYFRTFGAFGTGYGLAGISRSFSSAFVRYDNMLKYETPVMAGFKATAGYSRDAGIGVGTEDVKAFMAGMLYASGPLRFTVNYDRVSNLPDQGGLGTGALKAWNAALSWNFDVAEITLSAGQDIDGRISNMVHSILAPLGNVNPAPNAVHIDDFKATNAALSASVPLGHGKLLANWMMSDSNLDVATAGGHGIATQQALSLGYVHDLSERTSLYAVGTYMKNVAYIDQSSASEWTLGMMHRF